MITHRKFLGIFLAVCCFLSGCAGSAPASTETPTAAPTAAPTVPAPEIRDWAAEIQPSADTLKQEVTVKSFIDGDTTHFHLQERVNGEMVLKARYLAVNTPESTGKIEEYGKTASQFTREKLQNAEKILVESEDGNWNPDSGGERTLVWVWYVPQGETAWRCLNVELLQEGLANANSSARNRYGETCMAAIEQAKYQKKNLYSGRKDPNFYYGEAVELTLKELRTNIAQYNGVKVAFNGIITTNSGTQGVYIEDYDPELDRYFGIYIYYGHNLNGAGLDVLSVGNEARIVGTVQYYEAGGTWQVAGVNYRMMQPDDPGNIQKLSEGNAPAWVLTDPETFAVGTVTLETETGEQSFSHAQLALGTSVSMKGLTVTDAYTTSDPDSSSDGAITLTCEADGFTVTVRTAVLWDENGERITQDAFLGRTIDVMGIVDFFDGAYQIKVFSPNHITIN